VTVVIVPRLLEHHALPAPLWLVCVASLSQSAQMTKIFNRQRRALSSAAGDLVLVRRKPEIINP